MHPSKPMKTISALLLVASLLLAGCSSTSSHKPGQAVSQSQITKHPVHFWFNYPYEPSPGKRYWTCVGQTWIEQYENGEYSRFQMAGRAVVEGNAGTVVVKTAGDPEKTWTGNEANFQAFIHDLGSEKMVFRFRHKSEGNWQPWQSLAEIEGAE